MHFAGSVNHKPKTIAMARGLTALLKLGLACVSWPLSGSKCGLAAMSASMNRNEASVDSGVAACTQKHAGGQDRSGQPATARSDAMGISMGPPY